MKHIIIEPENCKTETGRGDSACQLFEQNWPRQLSLELHVQGVASQVLVELPQLGHEQFGRVAHVLLGVVAAHTTTRTTCAGNTISHHLSLLRALQDHQFPALLRWLPVGCHRNDAVPAGLTSDHFRSLQSTSNQYES